ncbi:type III PLP-dependent enzyme [Actinokineospora auranticolor]|uniref:Diaminopimelate decarboxylase n=1 Tax=Actinokineospora auranticolor TaxID=155976 RepID=A0A2S6H166_9PSEU|nr:decarboxylase [Actinokineospora auranticolor]PPK71204.1 diaminopimelate decarboxylase [Actinokineospora auranticolor]
MNRAELLQTSERYGTPLYLYDLAEVRDRANELLAALPGGTSLLYSLKANPLLPVVAELRGVGCGAEVSSLGELDVAVAAGFRAADVLYTGPGKSRGEIDAAIARGAELFSCESETELDRLGAAAADAGRRVRVLLRLQPGDRPASGLSMADGRQFGLTATEAVRAWPAAAESVELLGFHVYLGSQLGTVEHLLTGFTCAKAVVDEVVAGTGVPPRIVDLGGGFPWPYAAEGVGCDLIGLREGLTDLLSDWAESAPRVWFETGRRPTAAAGTLLTTVIDVKERESGVVVVVDAGINVLGGMAGLGRVLRLNTTVDNLSAADDRPEVAVDVVGPLCTPLDRVAARTPARKPAPGDVLRVHNVGAYGATASLTAFLSRPGPLELVVDGDEEVGAWRIDARAVPVTG